MVPGNPSSPNDGDNSTAKRWAQHYWDGDEEYQDDQKWYNLVLAADRARRTTPVLSNENESEKTNPLSLTLEKSVAVLVIDGLLPMAFLPEKYVASA